MKVKIFIDDWQVMMVDEHTKAKEHDVPEHILQRWKGVQTQWETVQAEMDKVYRGEKVYKE